MYVSSLPGQFRPDLSEVNDRPARKARQRNRNRFVERILDRREKALQAGLHRRAERLLCLAWEAYEQEAGYIL